MLGKESADSHKIPWTFPINDFNIRKKKITYTKLEITKHLIVHKLTLIHTYSNTDLL